MKCGQAFSGVQNANVYCCSFKRIDLYIFSAGMFEDSLKICLFMDFISVSIQDPKLEKNWVVVGF